MPTIATAISTLRTKVRELAVDSGRAQSLSSRELKKGVEAGTITEAQKDVLNLALAKAGSGDVEKVIRQLDTFQKQALSHDNDRNGRLDPDELKAIGSSASDLMKKLAELQKRTP